MIDQVEVSGKLNSNVWVSGSIDADINNLTGTIDVEQIVSHKVIHCIEIPDKPVDVLLKIRGEVVSIRCPNLFNRTCKFCYYGTPDESWFMTMLMVRGAVSERLNEIKVDPMKVWREDRKRDQKREEELLASKSVKGTKLRKTSKKKNL
jgi:hypothetical protein